MQKETYSVLVVTKDSIMTSFVNILFAPPLFESSLVADINEARRKCAERCYSIVVVDSKDDTEVDFCLDISDSSSTILLLVSQAIFEQVSYRAETAGILTFVRTFDTFSFYNIIKVAIAVQYKVKSLCVQTFKLKEKMQEIRIVNQAKCILAKTKGMTENEAHRFIEKEAMDKCTKKLSVAQEIIQEDTLNRGK